MTQEKQDFVAMPDAELSATLTSLEHEYQQLKFDHAVKGLGNPMEIRELRRDIARVYTEARARQLAAMAPDELANRTKLRARRKR